MFARITGAALRGILVALLIAMPSFILPETNADAPELALLVGLIAALLTFSEYNASFPSYVEFRDAPPYNRIRFVALFAMVVTVSLIAVQRDHPTGLGMIVSGMSVVLARFVDFPYSPVRFLVMVIGDGNALISVETIRVAAGVAHVIGIVSVLSLLMKIRLHAWPTGRGAFNVWVNLPLFDPTAGGDVVARLHRDGRINIALGLLLPFVLPGVLWLLGDRVGPVRFADLHTMIWLICAWAFLPASAMMRGIAMIRVAQLIALKRRRVYASAVAEGVIQPA